MATLAVEGSDVVTTIESRTTIPGVVGLKISDKVVFEKGGSKRGRAGAGWRKNSVLSR
jgi:hypothetical protein